ncbi:MAG: NADH-quinone oxidoreductase subunit B family protein [Candidatus Hydrothermarchaeales archaeon]
MKVPVAFAKKDDLLKIAEDEDKRSAVVESMKNGRDYLIRWGRKSSLWGYAFGLACCSVEMICFGAARWDADRFGVIFRGSPRQSDLMIVGGTVTKMMAPRIRRLYHQMAEPRWVIATGECAITGGPFWDSYSIVMGTDKIIPVDVVIPGCPANPDALFDGIIKLQKKIMEGDAGR